MYALVLMASIMGKGDVDLNNVMEVRKFVVDSTDTTRIQSEYNGHIIWMMFGLNAVFIISTMIFFFRSRQARKLDMIQVLADREQAKIDRAKAASDREFADQMRTDMFKVIELIKGWSVVNADTSAKTKVNLENRSDEVKQQIKAVESKVDNLPTKVAEQILQQSNGDSTAKFPIPGIT